LYQYVQVQKLHDALRDQSFTRSKAGGFGSLIFDARVSRFSRQDVKVRGKAKISKVTRTFFVNNNCGVILSRYRSLPARPFCRARFRLLSASSVSP
jgi:hypothetical protein